MRVWRRVVPDPGLAERVAWEAFRPLLAALSTFDAALALALDGPPAGRPGHRFHANLAYLLETLAAPSASTPAERVLYLRLVRRLGAAGELGPGEAAGAVENLQQVLDAPPFALPAGNPPPDAR